MLKIVNTIERELALTDFVVNKLSERLLIMEFNGYAPSEKSAKVDGRDTKYNVFAVKCTNHFNNKQIIVNVTATGPNKGLLDVLTHKMNNNPLGKVFVDFEDVVVGHYVSGGNGFAQLVQSYKAETVKEVDIKEVEKIVQSMKQVADPVAQMQQEQQKK